jgi:hypothetical protein
MLDAFVLEHPRDRISYFDFVSSRFGKFLRTLDSERGVSDAYPATRPAIGGPQFFAERKPSTSLLGVQFTKVRVGAW